MPFDEQKVLCFLREMETFAFYCLGMFLFFKTIFIHFDTSSCMDNYRNSILLFLVYGFSALVLSIQLSV